MLVSQKFFNNNWFLIVKILFPPKHSLGLGGIEKAFLQTRQKAAGVACSTSMQRNVSNKRVHGNITGTAQIFPGKSFSRGGRAGATHKCPERSSAKPRGEAAKRRAHYSFLWRDRAFGQAGQPPPNPATRPLASLQRPTQAQLANRLRCPPVWQVCAKGTRLAKQAQALACIRQLSAKVPDQTSAKT